MAARNLRVTVATKDYDHTRDVAYGSVAIEGVDPVWLHLPVEEIFHRFFAHREFDVSEVSMAKYCSAVAAGDTSITAIPVFPTRVFRHSSIWVRADAAIGDPSGLAGRRVGVPEWGQTAGIYIRGMIAHDYGVDLRGIDWFQGGVNQAGRREHATLTLPAGIRVTPVPERSLNEMLLQGDLDAILSARPPRGSHREDGRVRRLFADPEAEEKPYYARTGIYPIMHTIAVKQELVDRNPWLPTALYKAFSAAKANSMQRMLDGATPRVPLPWIRYDAERALREFGGDPWPYGGTFSKIITFREVGGCHACPQRSPPRRREGRQLHQTVRAAS